MANTEVGTAWVTIIPSAKGFARTLQKAIAKEFAGSNLDRMISEALAGARVTIPARAELDTSDIPDQLRGREPELPVRLDPLMAAFEDELRRELVAHQVTADIPVGADTTALRSDITTAVAAVESSVSANIDTEPAGQVGYERGLRSMVAAVARRVRATIHADVEVDKPSLDRLHTKIDADVGGRTGRKIGDDAGKGFLAAFGSAVRSATGTSPWLLLAGTAVGVTLLSAVSAAITGGLLGGAGIGLIGIGALILREQPEVAEAARRLAFTFETHLKGLATPLIDPLVKAMSMMQDAITEWGPQIRQMFELIAPAIEPLTRGLIGFVSNMLPGIVELIREATPFLIRLAADLPRLGEYIGAFFRLVDGGGPEASMFFSDLIDLVGLLVLALGVTIRVFTEFYPVFRELVKLSPIGTFLNLIRVIWLTRDAANSLASQATAAFRHLAAIVTAVFQSMRREPEAWVRWIIGIPGRILRALGGLGDLLRGAGRALINGLVSGIRAAIPNLQGVLGWVTNMIPSWKGPEDRDRVLLEPAGHAIMGGLIRGIHGERRALEAELGSVTALVAGTPLTSPPSGFGTSLAATASAPRLTAEWIGSTADPLTAALKENIRISYEGDPVAALGTVSR